MTKEITRKQLNVIGYIIGTISYMAATPDLYDPKWYDEIDNIVEKHKQEYELTDSEARRLKNLMGSILVYIKDLNN